MVDLGLPLENIWVTDIEGVVRGPHDADGSGQGALRAEDGRAQAGRGDRGADVFLGLSAGACSPEMVAAMGTGR